MDPLTAKTLVSALLVFAIALFSIASFEAFLTEIVRDLRSARAARKAAEPLPRR
ncbi:hypothetical protein [Methylobacterium sp. A54F]